MTEKQIEKLIQKLQKYAKKKLSENRYEHSVRVANMCQTLCKNYGLNEKIGYLVGISHDICKEIKIEKMIKFTKKMNYEISDFEKKYPKLLHGVAASYILKNKFNVFDDDVLESVSFHVSGKINFCDLGKCLFLADKIEPNRPQSTTEYREKLMLLSLNKMFLSVIQENYEYIVSKGYVVFPKTLEMIEYYKNLK